MWGRYSGKYPWSHRRKTSTSFGVQADEHIHDLRMTRLTFSVAASPYLASRVIQQTSEDHANEFPKASQVALHQFYVEDFLTGAESPGEAI